MTVDIRFGTDGWRAVLGDEFTFDNVRRCAQGLADYLLDPARKGQPAYRNCPFRDARENGVLVGWDARMLSGRFASEVARVLAQNGIPVGLSEAVCPTPAVSLGVVMEQRAGGVVITSSHNPPEYNGFKFKPEYGGSGLPEMMAAIQARIPPEPPPPHRPLRAEITPVHLRSRHLERLASLVDIERIRQAGLRIVADPMHGAGMGCLRDVVGVGPTFVREVRGEPNPGFGGINPEPIDKNLEPLRKACRAYRAHAGIAVDGDADRLGAMDGSGRFYNSHEIFAILLQHLVEHHGRSGSVVKTFSTSVMVDTLASRYGLPLHEVPIGFKYIVDRMLTEDVLIGGEESGGIGIQGHLPERDGLYCGLLLLEAMAVGNTNLRGLLKAVQRAAGAWYYDREDLQGRLPPAQLVAELKRTAPAVIGGEAVSEVRDLDGFKLMLRSGGWLLVRPSGTEPVVRVYAEARSTDTVSALLRDGIKLVRKAGSHD